MNATSEPKRPNILLIMTDQHRADHLGCAGHLLLKTPNIDQLAKSGVRATHFFAASTTCMASRSSLMTGRLPSAHGVVHNGINLSTGHTTFVELLRDAGFVTGLIGKSHLQSFGYDHPNKRGWTNSNGGISPSEELKDARKNVRAGPSYQNEWTPSWRDGTRSKVDVPYYGFDHVELCTLHGDHVQGDYAHWLHERHPEPDRLRGRENAIPDDRYSAPQAWRTGMPEELYPSTYVGERSCQWLREKRRSSPDKPFFLQCSFPDPHHPFTPPGKYWDMYRPSDVALPKSFHRPGTSHLLEDIHKNTQQGVSREGHAAFAVNAREAQEINALTFGMISLVDFQIGQIMSTLRELQIDKETIVIFTSDHGDLMGDHGVVLKGAMHFDGLTRVPFIWSDPGLPRTVGRVVDVPCGNLDLAATLLDRVGLAPYNGMQGVSLLNWLNGDFDAKDEKRPGVLIESEPVLMPPGRTKPYRLRSLITSRWRYTVSNDPALCELYDLQNDPAEQTNCWSTQAAARGDLSEQLLMLMCELSDRSPIPAAVA